jgi:acyl-CoA reductase-like NAD-dependent aldehyde dehydrogenase
VPTGRGRSVHHRRALKLLSFTGSPQVGWELKAQGRQASRWCSSSAATRPASSTPTLTSTTRSSGCTFGAFYQSGQSCISVQRILVHESLYDELQGALRRAYVGSWCTAIRATKKTFIGPMISEKEAERLHGWIEDAVERRRDAPLRRQARRRDARGDGARERARDCDVSTPRRPSARSRCSPPSRDFDEALAEVNDSRFGLQAGIFTNDHTRFSAPGTPSTSAAW